MSYCKANCPDIVPFEDCITGIGHCYYSFDFCGCDAYPENWWGVYCFFTYLDDDCEEPGPYAPYHENDVPRTLLFEYSMCDIPGTKYETYPVPDSQKRVIAFRNPKASMNIKIKHQALVFLNYDVAGELDPDAAGNYTGESESPFDPLNTLPESVKRPSYVGPLREFFLWWNGIDTWFLSDNVGDISNPYWSKVGVPKIGDYNPQNGAVGVATVAIGEL